MVQHKFLLQFLFQPTTAIKVLCVRSERFVASVRHQMTTVRYIYFSATNYSLADFYAFPTRKAFWHKYVCVCVRVFKCKPGHKLLFIS